MELNCLPGTVGVGVFVNIVKVVVCLAHWIALLDYGKVVLQFPMV